MALPTDRHWCHHFWYWNRNRLLISENKNNDCNIANTIHNNNNKNNNNNKRQGSDNHTTNQNKRRRCSNTNINKTSDTCNINSNCCQAAMKMMFFIIALVSCGFTEAALRNVNLYIEPPAVRRGQSVTLRCHYDLEGAPLYSVKFYRGQLEFYRYTPGEHPSTKVFHYPGIKVDEFASNATQAVIRSVGFNLSGNFSCEVTADAPLFSTATAYASMQVVEFPEKRPQLFTEHNRYEPGDVLRANCSTPPSRPRAELRFTINNVMVSSGETEYIRTVDNLIASRISLKLQLQGIHFMSTNPHTMNGNAESHGQQSIAGGVGGGLVLRCTAQIGDLYQEYKEIELAAPQRDPVPARVTLSSGSGLKTLFDSYFSVSSATGLFGRGRLPAALRTITATATTITTAATMTATTSTTTTTPLHAQKLIAIIIIAAVTNALHRLQVSR